MRHKILLIKYKMANAWLSHVKKTMKRMKSSGSYKKGDGLKKVILAAKKTYKKGGALVPPGPPVKPDSPSTPTMKHEEEDKVAFAPTKVRQGASRKTRRGRSRR
jgi:molybdenum cofactor biosynthesis enzyme